MSPAPGIDWAGQKIKHQRGSQNRGRGCKGDSIFSLIDCRQKSRNPALWLLPVFLNNNEASESHIRKERQGERQRDRGGCVFTGAVRKWNRSVIRGETLTFISPEEVQVNWRSLRLDCTTVGVFRRGLCHSLYLHFHPPPFSPLPLISPSLVLLLFSFLLHRSCCRGTCPWRPPLLNAARELEYIHKNKKKAGRKIVLVLLISWQRKHISAESKEIYRCICSTHEGQRGADCSPGKKNISSFVRNRSFVLREPGRQQRENIFFTCKFLRNE